MKFLMRLGCLAVIAAIIFGVYLLVKKLTRAQEEVDLITGKKPDSSIAQKKEGFKFKLPFGSDKTPKASDMKTLDAGGMAFRTASTAAEKLQIVSWNVDKNMNETIVRITFQVRNTGSDPQDVYWQNKYLHLQREPAENDKLPASADLPPASGDMQLAVQPGKLSNTLQITYNLSPRWFMGKKDPALSWGNYDFTARKIPQKIPLKK